MKNESIQAIKEALASVESKEDQRLALWRSDQRAGVQQALKQWERRMLRHEKEQALFEEMCYFEKQAKAQNHHAIAGIDEVGRGPLAGPVVAAAVILPEDFVLLGVNDSKKLSAKKREELYETIQKEAISVGIGIVDHQTIDQVNIYQATKLAMIQAIKQLPIEPDYLLIDAMKLEVPIPQENLIKGDARSISIAAASIIAKVYRDQLMQDYGQNHYPGYGFESNAGYGTKEHLEGLKKMGICPIHRKTFAPIKDMI